MYKIRIEETSHRAYVKALIYYGLSKLFLIFAD